MAGTITHYWDGTKLVVTSDSGTSSCDLKGSVGDVGARGCQGEPGVLMDSNGEVVSIDDYYTKEEVDEKLDNIDIPEGAGGTQLTQDGVALDTWEVDNAVLITNAEGSAYIGMSYLAPLVKVGSGEQSTARLIPVKDPEEISKNGSTYDDFPIPVYGLGGTLYARNKNELTINDLLVNEDEIQTTDSASKTYKYQVMNLGNLNKVAKGLQRMIWDINLTEWIPNTLTFTSFDGSTVYKFNVMTPNGSIDQSYGIADLFTLDLTFENPTFADCWLQAGGYYDTDDNLIIQEGIEKTTNTSNGEMRIRDGVRLVFCPTAEQYVDWGNGNSTTATVTIYNYNGVPTTITFTDNPDVADTEEIYYLDYFSTDML